ncbi:MAG: hypothetical protein PUF37_05365 [Prevotellaceae bacterium]|nr:hypothetical protein [Prevotellaceae bacterium]
MEITINKEDFERSLPVGTSAQDNVFDMVQPAIEEQKEWLQTAVLGPEGESYLEKQKSTSLLMGSVKKYVCQHAFLSVLRQLDLVLTPTGFGVVSNDNVAPASKQRVDALEGQLRTAELKSMAIMLRTLRSEAWGATTLAVTAIPHVYDLFAFFYNRPQPRTWTDWQNMQTSIEGLDCLVREAIGDAQADDILDAFRRNDTQKMKREQYGQIIECVTRLTDMYEKQGVGCKRSVTWRRMMLAMDDEGNADIFALYRGSSNYKANHYEGFQNSQDKAGFVFGG